MNNLYIKSEQQQNDLTVNASPHNQSLQGDSLSAVSRLPVLKCEQQQWDVKPDLYLQLKQDLTPGLSFKSELPASTSNLFSQQYQDDKTIVSTQHQDDQAHTSMDFFKKYNGLLYFILSFLTVLDI